MYEYDVAISFGLKDELVANRLEELLKGRLKVFLYSKEQEKLAGTDGEKTFNEVFGTSRLVVVLYREAWGTTPFTRFEETAIRNRAYQTGYDFTVFIPMNDERQKVPAWLPKNRLYVGLERWGIESAAAVIEARFSELGGEIREESIDDIASRTASALAHKEKLGTHLSSAAGVATQVKAYATIKADLLNAAERLKTALPSINLEVKIGTDPNGAILFLSNPVALSVTWLLKYTNSLTGASLEATLWEGHPPWPGIMPFSEPRKIKTLRYTPDLMVDGSGGWKPSQGRNGPITSNLASDEILKLFLKKVQEG